MKRLINLMKRSQLDHPPTPLIIHIQERGIYKNEGKKKVALHERLLHSPKW